MKRILVIVLSVVMLFSLVIAVPSFAAEEENVALGKPVYAVLNGGGATDATFWGPAMLVDGVAQDTTNGNALGWSFSTAITAGLNVDISAYIDLGALYSVDSIVVVPMQWVPSATYPGAYEIYVSKDFVNWTKVGEASADKGPRDGNDVYSFDAVEAQFVRLRCTSMNGAWADTAFLYNGFGDLQVFGTKVKDSNYTLKEYKNYNGTLINIPEYEAGEVLGGTTAWIGHTSGSLEYSITFQTDVSFWAVNFPLSWGAYGTPLKFTLEKDGSTVFTKNIVRNGDGALTVDFGDTLEAGQYVLKLTITDDTLADENKYAYYNVIGHASEPLGEEYCINSNGTGSVLEGAMILYSFDEGRGFVKIGEETQPATEPAAGLRDFDSAKGDHMSYDQILVNDAEIANGNDAVIAAKALIDGSDGTIENVAMYGWYGNDNSKIESFGYMIDNNDPVFGEFKFEPTEQAVIDNGGESRYKIVIDVTGLKDGETHKIQAVAKLENGEIVKLNRNDNGTKDRDAYVNYKAQYVEEPHTQTGDTSVAIFAAVAVLALGAAVVLLKKKAY